MDFELHREKLNSAIVALEQTESIKETYENYVKSIYKETLIEEISKHTNTYGLAKCYVVKRIKKYETSIRFNYLHENTILIGDLLNVILDFSFTNKGFRVTNIVSKKSSFVIEMGDQRSYEVVFTN